MFKPLNIIFYLLAVILVLGCKKKFLSGKTDLTISMYDLRTGEPIDGPSFRVYQSKGSLTQLAGSKVKEITTGNLIDGKADLTFKSKRGFGWVTHLTFPSLKLDYYYEDINFDFVLDKFEKNHIDIPVIPLCNLTYHIQNVDCFNEADSMSLNKRHIILDPESKTSPTEGDWGRSYFIGCTNELLGPLRVPAGNYQVVLRVVKDGVVTYPFYEFYIDNETEGDIELFY